MNESVQDPLTASDRCLARGIDGVGDGRCGARARVRVHFETGALEFCARHYDDNKAALTEEAVAIQDESERIQEEEDKREGV